MWLAGAGPAAPHCGGQGAPLLPAHPEAQSQAPPLACSTGLLQGQRLWTGASSRGRAPRLCPELWLMLCSISCVSWSLRTGHQHARIARPEPLVRTGGRCCWQLLSPVVAREAGREQQLKYLQVVEWDCHSPPMTGLGPRPAPGAGKGWNLWEQTLPESPWRTAPPAGSLLEQPGAGAMGFGTLAPHIPTSSLEVRGGAVRTPVSSCPWAGFPSRDSRSVGRAALG